MISGALFLSGCGKDEVKVYSVPKEKASTPRMAGAHPEALASQDSPPVHWTTPPGWKELAPTSIRVGNLLVTKDDKKAEVSIIPLPGNVGTELENVNRWRGEVGLGEIAEGEISRQAVPVGVDAGRLYDLSGSVTQTVVAILERPDATWFFKMRGDKEVVTDAKPAFVEFLKSIKFHDDHHAEPARQTSTAPIPVSPSVAETPASPTGDTPSDIPPGWKETPPPAMVLKSFSVGDAANEAKIAVSRFPGDVGGLLANVNRWRGQLSLDRIQAADLAKLAVPIDGLDEKATLVDMKSTDGKTRMIVATIPRDGQTWFYKLMGDEATVGREKAALIKFVQSARYPNE